MATTKHLEKTIETLQRGCKDRDKRMEHYQDWAVRIMDLLQQNADGEISAGDVVQGISELHHPDAP